MTFEKYWQSICRGWRDQMELSELSVKDAMAQGWNAAKEDSKESVTIEWSDLVEDWSVRDFRGAAIEDGFTSKEDAQSWAEFKGYRVE